MIRSILITTLLFAAQTSLAAQEVAADATLPKYEIHWLSLEDAETLHRDSLRNFLFMVYNEDCHWCQKMQQETLADSSIVAKIDTQFYPVRFTMEKAGQFFISSMLLSVFKVQNFPAIFFFSDSFQPLTNTSGFQTLEQFKPHLMYASDTKYYQNMTFDDFKKTWDKIHKVAASQQ